jgi:hypothetical protein
MPWMRPARVEARRMLAAVIWQAGRQYLWTFPLRWPELNSVAQFAQVSVAVALTALIGAVLLNREKAPSMVTGGPLGCVEAVVVRLREEQIHRDITRSDRSGVIVWSRTSDVER